MNGVWIGRCEGCNNVHELVTLNLGTGSFTPALCVECEARLRLISTDNDRLRYTIGQLLKSVPMESLTGDLPQSAVEEISRVVVFARNQWKADRSLRLDRFLGIDTASNPVRDDKSIAETFISNDLLQRIRTQVQNPEALAQNYATYAIRQEDKIVLHSLGVEWDLNDQTKLPARPSEEQCASLKTSRTAESQSTTPKLFEKS